MESSKAILPIEIKFAQKINRPDLRALKDFITEKNCPIGWVLHNGERIEWLDDKILGIPATCIWFTESLIQFRMYFLKYPLNIPHNWRNRGQ